MDTLKATMDARGSKAEISPSGILTLPEIVDRQRSSIESTHEMIARLGDCARALGMHQFVPDQSRIHAPETTQRIVHENLLTLTQEQETQVDQLRTLTIALEHMLGLDAPKINVYSGLVGRP